MQNLLIKYKITNCVMCPIKKKQHTQMKFKNCKSMPGNAYPSVVVLGEISWSSLLLDSKEFLMRSFQSMFHQNLHPYDCD